MDYTKYYLSNDNMDSALSMLEALKKESVYSMSDIEYWVTNYEILYMSGIKHFLDYHYENNMYGKNYPVWQEPESLPKSAHSFFKIYRSLSKATEDFLKEPHYEKIVKEYEEIHCFDPRLRKVWYKAYKKEALEVFFDYHELAKPKYGLEQVKSLKVKDSVQFDIDVDIRDFTYRYLFCETMLELISEFGGPPPGYLV